MIRGRSWIKSRNRRLLVIRIGLTRWIRNGRIR